MVVTGTLDFGTVAAKTLNLTGDLSGTGSILMSGLAHNLNLGGTNNTISTFTPTVGFGTVNYSGTGDQNVFGSNNYQNLALTNGGIKSLQASSIINNNLVLTSGILRLGNYNLTLNNTANNAIQGSAFTSLNMIETGGNGYLIRPASTVLPISFPVGSGGYYSPMTITAIGGTAGGTISVRSVYDGTLGFNFLNRYWDVLTSTTGKIITATFDCDPTELSLPPKKIFNKAPAGSWAIPVTGTSSYGGSSFTISGTSDIIGTSTYWSAGLAGTFYSYQSGDWNTSTTWTSDPTGTLQIGSSTPSTNDKVVILDGRTVSLSSDISSSGLDITIDGGGFLNLTDKRFTNDLLALHGQGTLQLASVNFPTVTPIGNNTLILAGGGTTEYNAAVTLPSTITNYNNLTINTTGADLQLNNLTLYGNLSVVNGTFQINDASATRRQLTVLGNVIVENSGNISVGTGNTVTGGHTPTTTVTGGTAPFINYYDQETHRIVIYGSFTNSGNVRFTNQTNPDFNTFPTTGAATVYFMGATNNSLICNGPPTFTILYLIRELIRLLV